RKRRKRNVENAAKFMRILPVVVKAFEMEITPANRIVAQIGDAVVLTCNATGCASPSFSWRIQTDNPLGGTVTHHGTYSTLTMSAVNINNAHDYLCTVCCKDEKKEKSVKIEVYSFPSDPVIEISTSLAAGEQTIVICTIPRVYPSDRLEVLLKKGDRVLHEQNFYEDHSTNAETKTVTYSFNLTTEDIGKEISCVAKLPIADMDFEPKERVTSQKLNANFGPKNTVIIASPSNSAMEGHSINLTCVTDSNPPPQIVWRRQVADKIVQCASENNVLTIPQAHFTDSGLYICEVTNLLTNKTEKATVEIVIQAPPKNTTLIIFPSNAVKQGERVTISCTSTGVPTVQITLRKKTDGAITTLKTQDGKYTLESVLLKDAGIYECVSSNELGEESQHLELDVKVPPQNITVLVHPSENVQEGENVTITCSTYSNPPPQMILKKVHPDKEIILTSVNGTFVLYNVTESDTGTYLLDVFNEVGNNIKMIEIAVVGRVENPNQMMLVIIAFSCVTGIAVPVVAILIYVSRQAKINGSYSLVKALRLKV
ncbi:VCAM1 protein, partial [Nothoprocta pentlandii]|nr:VCAM1 protein [Nothoprocta pentlandii]